MKLRRPRQRPRHPDPLVSQYAQSFYTPWTSDHTLYRVDRPWGDDGLMRGAMRGWRLYRINRAAPGRIIAGTDNGLHCGNIPTSDAMSKRMSAIRILHLGYTRREDRVRKYERYKRQDPNPDRALVGGSSYEHLINEDVVTLSQFNDRNGAPIQADVAIQYSFDQGYLPKMFNKLRKDADAISHGFLRTQVRDKINRQSESLDVTSIFGQERSRLLDRAKDALNAELSAEYGINVHTLAIVGKLVVGRSAELLPNVCQELAVVRLEPLDLGLQGADAGLCGGARIGLAKGFLDNILVRGLQ